MISAYSSWRETSFSTVGSCQVMLEEENLHTVWTYWFAFPATVVTGLLIIVFLCSIDQPTRLTWTPYKIYGGMVKRKMSSTRPNNTARWRPLPKRPGLPQHLSSAKGWSPQCHSDAVICAKGLTNYCVHKWMYFSGGRIFCISKYFFILIFWGNGFWFSWAVNQDNQN